MDYFITEDQKHIQALARRIAEERIVPIRAELDENEEFPWGIMKICAETGLFGVSIPEAYGGMGGGCFENCIVVEELSRACLGVSVSYAASLLGAHPILLGGSEELKKKYLTDIASGKRLAAFALTEPNAGSDAQGIRTEAKKLGDEYILNGTKQWITNGGEAEIYTVIAKTDRSKGGRGATAFILEKGMEGFPLAKRRKSLVLELLQQGSSYFRIAKFPKKML